MEYELIYEISEFPLLEIARTSTAPMFIFMVIVGVMYIRQEMRKLREGNKRDSFEIISIFVVSIILIFLVIGIVSMCIDGIENETWRAAKAYHQGEFEVIEGYVVNNSENIGERAFSFYINDMVFDIYKFGIKNEPFESESFLTGKEYFRVSYVRNPDGELFTITKIERRL